MRLPVDQQIILKPLLRFLPELRRSWKCTETTAGCVGGCGVNIWINVDIPREMVGG